MEYIYGYCTICGKRIEGQDICLNCWEEDYDTQED